MFSDFERDQIIAYNNIEMSFQRITHNIKHSKFVIFNFSHNRTIYDDEKSIGRPGSFSKLSGCIIK